jgi:hypothetical protein
MVAMSNKAFIAILLSAVFASSIVVSMAYAQTTVPSLSVPEFTLAYVDGSYEVTPYVSTDPYTGANTTVAGYHVNSGIIVISIKNQPFNSSNGIFFMSYEIDGKGHFGDNWTTLYSINASDSDYTVVSYSENYSPSVQLDFRVRTFLYNETQIPVIRPFPYAPGEPIQFQQQLNLVQATEWSNSQTVTIPQPFTSETPTATSILTPTPTPSPIVTPAPTQVVIQSTHTWFFIIIVELVLVIVVLLGIIALVLRKRRG